MPPRVLAVLTTLLALLAVASPAAAQTLPKLSTPQLIERAGLGKAQELRMLAYAIGRPGRLPERFRSDAPWDGTMPLLRLQREAPKLRDAAARSEIMAIIAPDGGRPNTDPSVNCSVLSVGPEPEVKETEHFYIEYLPGAFTGGLTIDDYAASLEGAWQKEVDDFGFAAPPMHPDAPGTPGPKYNVRIGLLGPGLYGFVSSQGTYAGEVGDNPNTSSWVEDDAEASCMGLNADYETGFEQLTVGTARQRLDATTAHEFFHSIHFGYGALDGGDNEPDLSFTEGHASWMEDEVYDGADDNYNYLYPAFDDGMGEHEGSEYAYWLTFRGLTERFGTGTPGAGQDFVRRFWEMISREEWGPMDAIELAYLPTGVPFSHGFHDYARAARFMKACGGRYVLPYCFEEAEGYADVAGRPEPHGSIDQVAGSHGTAEEPAEIEDNYALNWIDLPAPDQEIEAHLDDMGGSHTQLRMSIVCDTGSSLRVTQAAIATAGQDARLRFDPRGCTSRPSAVITNETRSGDPRFNPDEDPVTPYVLRTNLAPPLPPAEPPPPPPPPPPPVTPFIAPPPPPVACAAGSRLGRANAFTHPRGVRFSFRPRGGSRVGIDVFQSSIRDEVVRARLVARFRGRRRSFVWDGESNLENRRVRNGYLFVRFRARNATGVDIKRAALVRRRGVFRARPSFATADRCATLASFKLLRPVFGGSTNRSIGVSYRVNRVARATLEVIQNGDVVARYRHGFREPGRTFRLRVRARRFERGNVTFRLRLQRQGARPIVARLVARKL